MSDTRDKIIGILEEAEGDGCSAKYIASLIFGKDGKPSMVNPDLYKMEREGLIRKEGERPPMWFIADDPLVTLMRKIDLLSIRDQEKLREYLSK
jgi:hypothetical protein